MILLFAATLFTSAALLFLIQPMIAKMILPLLGGSPAVWNTCIVFFQAILLGGYLYAHLSTQLLSRKRQVMVHLALIVASLIYLPIIVTREVVAPATGTPVWWLLGLLATTTGVPLLVISATSPLFQRWFAASTAKDPYALYAAGNFGSMLALVAYPGLFEPTLTLKNQSAVWAAGYLAFAILALACAVSVWRTQDRLAPGPSTVPETEPPSWRIRGQWMLLALIPSSLMLGVTTFLTTDIAAVPLLWVLPLSLYLLTFVLVFAQRPPVPHPLMVRLLPLLVLPLVSLTVFDTRLPAIAQIALHVSTFFVASMVCHGELARGRPSSAHLTTFYLCLASGGVLGGIVNAILAPILFKSIIEYPLMIVLVCLVRPALRSLKRSPRWVDLAGPLVLGAATLGLMFVFKGAEAKNLAGIVFVFIVPAVACFSFRHRPARFAFGVAALILSATAYMSAREPVLYRGRSFFSVHSVLVDESKRFRLFVHGGIVHGSQSVDPVQRRQATAYFYRTGPIGQLFAAMAAMPKRHIGVVGLGVGSLAAYSEADQIWTFYEIDPAVADIARDRRYFTYLNDSPARMRIVLGDARLSLQHAADKTYDLLVLDAFSSDAVPVHLLTREALRLYLSKLARDGMIAFNISNRYVELEPLLGDLAGDARLICLEQDDLRVRQDELQRGKYGSRWLVMAHRLEDFGPLKDDSRWHVVSPRPQPVVWTDDFSNLLSVFKWRL